MQPKNGQVVRLQEGAENVAAEMKSEGELPLSTKFRFAGTVIGPNKLPVAGAHVYIAQMNAKPLATTDEQMISMISR